MPNPRDAAPQRPPAAFDDVLNEVAATGSGVSRNAPVPSATVWTLLDKTVIGSLCAASVAFCVYAIAITVENPNYFSEKLISSLQSRDLDPIRTGTVAQPAVAVDALPVPIVARAQELKPEDYQIVMVFDDEAILATSKELFRVKVGSTLPGLGLVREIVPNGDGGTVAAEKATLRTAPN